MKYCSPFIFENRRTDVQFRSSTRENILENQLKQESVLHGNAETQIEQMYESLPNLRMKGINSLTCKCRFAIDKLQRCALVAQVLN